MSPEQFFREVSWPLRSLACLFAMFGFLLLLGLAAWAGILGIYLAVIVLPALFRYLVMVAEARAGGRDVAPPGIEFFTLGGGLWTLFPVLPALAVGAIVYWAAGFGVLPAWIAGLAGITLFAAMTAVLVITHSPLQSLNPLALLRLAIGIGWPLLLAPLLVLTGGFVIALVARLPLPVTWFLELYFLFAWFALIGALLREHDLLEEIEVPEADGIRAGQATAELEHERTQVLNHAYALASRGNRAGALKHVGDWLASDPEPARAWPWFFDNMLGWEDRNHALFFAQRYLGHLLDGGEQVLAVKLMLRCRLEDDGFRPLPDDLPAAVTAAEACGNPELARALVAGAPDMVT